MSEVELPSRLAGRIDKKNRVSVLGVAKAIVARRPDLDCMTGEGLGGALVSTIAIASSPTPWRG
jgi:hypothetical protein